MKNTTLCYIQQNGCYLMLHRVKKQQDPNQGKWIGVGGKFEEGETPEECLLREVQEETGLTLTRYQLRGIVTFVSDEWGTEYMHLFTADEFSGKLADTCNEGELKWVPIDTIPSLSLWQGDRIFLKLLQTRKRYFSLKLCYRGDELVFASCDGVPIPVSETEETV